MKAVSCVGVVLLTALNGIVLFFASLLAAGGDGSADGIMKVRWFGYGWVALFAIAGLVLCSRGRGGPGVAVTGAALPAAFAAGLLVVVCGSFLGYRIG